jgi:hypothetical protein
MAIAAETIAGYAPWGNAVLTFEVGAGSAAVDPATGNPVQGKETLEYLAALDLQAPQWSEQEGADMTTYGCSGRLLTPAVFDHRITNGSRAQAVINGYTGRFELVYSLSELRVGNADLRQEIRGTFRVIGGVDNAA